MNGIKLTKENSQTIRVMLFSKGEELKLGSTDYLIFTVRKNIDDEEYLIRKKIVSTDYNEELKFYPINILPTDTKDIKLDNYNDEKFYRYDITLYNSEAETVQRTLIKGTCIISWRASRGDDE